MGTKARRSQKFIFLGIILVLALGIVGCSNGGDKEIVAKVNDEVITKDELYDLLVEQNGNQVLEALIQEKIVDAEAKKADIKISDEDLDKELEKMVEEAGGQAQFEQMLMYYGMDKDEMKNNLKTNLKIKALVKDDISVTDKDVEDYFLANKAEFEQVEEVKASHILVDEEEKAKEIYKELKDGGDFAELAKEHSKDGSAQFGGDLGFFPRGEMVKEFEEVAFSLGVGEISEPVKSEFGYHIIKVAEKQEAKEADLESNKEEIKDKVFEKKIPEAYQAWYQEVYPEYKIENKLKDK